MEDLYLINNGRLYSRYINPYEQMVNSSMLDHQTSVNKFSFKSKAFYEKAFELSQIPSIAKMDGFNPIYLHICNPKEYRYYN